MKKLSLLFWVLLLSVTAFAQQNRPVQFAWGNEMLPLNFEEAKSKPVPVTEEAVHGKINRYIQFQQTLTERERQEMTTSGLTFAAYVYPATYLVSMPQTFDLNRLEKFSPLSIVPVKPEWKMAKSLREPPYGEWALHGDWVDINLQVVDHASIAEGTQWCRENGLVILKQGVQNGFVQVRALISELPLIAAMPFVQYMELVPPPGKPEDTRGRSLHRANTIDSDHVAGIKLNGEGVKTLVRDDGQLGPHIDFQGRLYNRTGTPPAQGTHGDGVGGIIGGAGNLDPTKKGMASGADVYVVDYVNDFQDETLPLHLVDGVTITNSSYSDGCNVGYTLATQTVDEQLYENPTLMHVFSAGNSNGSDCGYGAGSQWGNVTGGHKMAKNAIATANLLQDGTLDPTSSRGPAYDGRLKPDIAANGTAHESTNPNNGYQVFGGTSGAAPGIAGCLAQLTQAYKLMNGGQEPFSALLKATILNTANDLGNAGPDYRFGYGQINAWRAFRLLQDKRYLTDTLGQADVKSHAVTFPAGLLQARVMLVWSDPPANQQAAQALLNDLDLTVVGPNGTTTYLPFKLNPTPNATTLNAPAGVGRDSLNNVEQVSINLPAAGDYQIQVNGTDVPFGPQGYFLTWEFVSDSIKLTYPNGGEGFAPGSTQRLHWDAHGNSANFLLRYSTDGGQTFSTISTVAADKRMYDWVVPNTVSGQVVVAVFRDAVSDVNDHAFSIVGVPQNIQVEQVCPTSMTIKCNPINDTLHFNAYLLGDKYMELVGTADTNVVTFPITDAGNAKWISMSAAFANGQTGSRAIAVQWPGELKNCPQDFDLGVRDLLAPSGKVITACNGTTQPITIQLKNEGLNTVSGALVNYQIDNNPVETATLPDIPVGQSFNLTFPTPIQINSNIDIHLKIWSDFANDIFNANDTAQWDLSIVPQLSTGSFTETFENLTELSPGWLISNPDQGISWELTTALTAMVDQNNQPTRGIYINHFDYSERGELDLLYMVPVDLAGVINPALSFDLAHKGYNNSFSDGLRIELFPGCDLGSTPVVLFEEFGADLATAGNQTGFYVPFVSTDWQTKRIDLNDFAGQKAIIRFTALNDYGNNTFIDNIGIQELLPPVLPVASFLSPQDTACRQQATTFEAEQITQNATYSWTFGTLATPPSATGPGPHSVTYLTPGNKVVILTATNSDGNDKDTLNVTVLPLPTPNFTQAANNLTVTFTNTSTNAVSYLWDFGDGFTSTEVNPVHTYATAGTYTVNMEATNFCKTNLKTTTLALTSAVKDLAETMSISLSPNPSSGDFVLTVNSEKSEDLQCTLLDAQGRVVTTVNSRIKTGANVIPFQGLKLPAGVYQLNLFSESGQTTFRVVVL